MKVAFLLLFVCSVVSSDRDVRSKRSPFYFQAVNKVNEVTSNIRDGVDAASNLIKSPLNVIKGQAANLNLVRSKRSPLLLQAITGLQDAATTVNKGIQTASNLITNPLNAIKGQAANLNLVRSKRSPLLLQAITGLQDAATTVNGGIQAASNLITSPFNVIKGQAANLNLVRSKRSPLLLQAITGLQDAATTVNKGIQTASNLINSPLNAIKGQAANLNLVRPKRSPFLFQAVNGMTNTVRNSVQATSNLVTGGVNAAVGTAATLTNAAVQTAGSAIDMGAQMTANAISAVSTPAANAMAILFIRNMNMILYQTGQDVLTLPALSSNLYGLGTIQTSEGSFSRISTLSNNGSVEVAVGRNGIGLTVPVSLGEMKVVYPTYAFRSWPMNLDGSISVGIASNKIVIRLRLLSLQDCMITIDKVEVQNLEGINVQLTGLCSFCSTAANYIVTYLEGIIKDQVQAALDAQLNGFSFGNVLMCAPLRQSG